MAIILDTIIAMTMTMWLCVIVLWPVTLWLSVWLTMWLLDCVTNCVTVCVCLRLTWVYDWICDWVYDLFSCMGIWLIWVRGCKSVAGWLCYWLECESVNVRLTVSAFIVTVWLWLIVRLWVWPRLTSTSAIGMYGCVHLCNCPKW
jgi:hypothetical protein